MHYIEQNILNSAMASFERGETSSQLFDKAERQRKTGMTISADFTECIATVVHRWETKGYDKTL